MVRVISALSGDLLLDDLSANVAALRRSVAERCRVPCCRVKLLSQEVSLEDSWEGELPSVLQAALQAVAEEEACELLAAVDAQDLELVTRLLHRCQDPNCHEFNETPLCKAALCGHLKIMETLLDAHASCEGTEADIGLPLRLAAESGHLSALQL
ncbi:unnamed protein product, partial [Effrenium voratum]